MIRREIVGMKSRKSITFIPLTRQKASRDVLFVFCKTGIHKFAIATTQCCNLTWSLCAHEYQAMKPAISRAGFACEGYHAHLSK